MRDFAAARPWYERLFGRPPDMLPMAHEAVWHLSQGGLIYVVEDPPRAGQGLLTLAVADLGECLAGLAARGLVTEPSQDRARVVRDPDGNLIELNHPIPMEAQL